MDGFTSSSRYKSRSGLARSKPGLDYPGSKVPRRSGMAAMIHPSLDSSLSPLKMANG